MLPSFPRIEGFRRQLNVRVVEALVGQLAPIHEQIDQHRQFEGREGTIRRADESEGDVHFEEMTATIEFPEGPIGDFTAAKLLAELGKIAEQLAESFSKHIIRVMEETTEQTGNVVDAKGRGWSHDIVLEAFEKMDLSFGDDGEWNPPTMMLAPDTFEKIRAAETPEAVKVFNDKLKLLVQKKYEEYRSREADRVLVG